MHLLATQPGQIEDGSEAIDLGQKPGDLIVLSAADTELAALSDALSGFDAGFPETRLANSLQLKHNLSVDIYCEDMIANAKLVIVRLLGGRAYWSYGVDQLVATCRRNKVKLALLPGDDKPDEELQNLSSMTLADLNQLHAYLSAGGPANMLNFWRAAANTMGQDWSVDPPEPVLKFGVYKAGVGPVPLSALKLAKDRGVAAIVFYRAHLVTANLQPIDALVEALEREGLQAVPLYVSSLKDPVVAAGVQNLMQQAGVGITLNTTSFAIGNIGTQGESTKDRAGTVLETNDVPVLQVILSTATKEAWESNNQGLTTRDLAMNVALPEVDGRLITRAISFKAPAVFDKRTQCQIVRSQAVPDRVSYIAQLAKNWLKLRQTARNEKRIAFVLANYPTRRARIGNGVGLDTPASIATVLDAMAQDFNLGDIPRTGRDLMDTLLQGPTNEVAGEGENEARIGKETLRLAAYKTFFASLPLSTQESILERWGPPEADPFVRDGAFQLAVHRFGNISVGIQPTRGYNLDPDGTYHDPDLVPPHGYLAFYAWNRLAFKAQAFVHFGKHGNLEWLPGKALALSETCFPDLILGSTPNIYPFIVNDPGEGTQAKRRTQAVILDHMTPPLTRAETYGDLATLERLIDEYFEASTLDPRRLKPLRKDIYAVLADTGLDKDLGIDLKASDDDALSKLDAHLCELKELQIRDGLHIFGQAPSGQQKRDLQLALARLPQGTQPSFLAALAKDFSLELDPLACDLAASFSGIKPERLISVSNQPWRTNGDAVERLELFAQRILDGEVNAPNASSKAVFDWVQSQVSDLIDSCGIDEVQNFLKALDGQFVPAGPSGAPTRGRMDVLPTGRNFFSVDSRSLPTQTAWALGWKAADQLLTLYRQENGEDLRDLAISMWGTANMRTGGDDIAQVLALLGCRPEWDATSGRVTGFEILPVSILGRPRVDVTVRVSGFFRDAFPAQIDLMDSAVRAVGKLDEPFNQNPIAERFQQDQQELIEEEGLSQEQASLVAGHRIFGSKPGAYGAGLQALIDEGNWDERKKLGEAYVAWSAYAYGQNAQSKGEDPSVRQTQVDHFKRLLGRTQAILQNQDNREHDILDSDDYYQFIGGLSSAVWSEQGQEAALYHGDNSRPETPAVRSLSLEIARVMRARVTNPKWIDGVMRHGYKGAFEMSATLDYLFGFAASTDAVAPHHFQAVYESFVQDEKVRGFLAQENPDALRDICARLIEALDKGFWTAKRNRTLETLNQIFESDF